MHGAIDHEDMVSIVVQATVLAIQSTALFLLELLGSRKSFPPIIDFAALRLVENWRRSVRYYMVILRTKACSRAYEALCYAEHLKGLLVFYDSTRETQAVSHAAS
jgi:hypothetical protein